jgi:hypothetical protein
MASGMTVLVEFISIRYLARGSFLFTSLRLIPRSTSLRTPIGRPFDCRFDRLDNAF